MAVTTRTRSRIIDDIDLKSVDPGNETPKPKRARKTAPSTSKVKRKVISTTPKPNKVVKKVATRKKAPKEEAPKEKTPKGRKSKEKTETPAKPRAKRNSGIMIPEGLDIPNGMKGRILRASRERIFILSRERTRTYEEQYQVNGSTGNLYTIVVGPRLSCSCLDFRYRRVHCKHLLAVLLKTFRLPITSPMFTNLNPNSQVLQEIFEKCIPDPSSFVPEELQSIISKRINGEPEDDTNINTQRRPLDTSDCPVCCEEFKVDEINEVAYCRTCGNNIHQICFNMWKASRGNSVTCVFCRSPWNPNKKKKVAKNVNAEGFVNIGAELGLLEKRDTTSYGRVFGDLNEELSKNLYEEIGKRK
ncbi:unnamed protein product [Cunninghamella blakesleeana]